LSKNIIEPVPCDSEEFIVHYIPHMAVVRLDKSFTKVRIVYDASSKTNNKVPSLNDCLLKGPDLSADLCGMLLRARLRLILMTLDVEKAFLQGAGVWSLPQENNRLRRCSPKDTGHEIEVFGYFVNY
jgi:hypothetical protein